MLDVNDDKALSQAEIKNLADATALLFQVPSRPTPARPPPHCAMAGGGALTVTVDAALEAR